MCADLEGLGVNTLIHRVTGDFIKSELGMAMTAQQDGYHSIFLIFPSFTSFSSRPSFALFLLLPLSFPLILLIDFRLLSSSDISCCIIRMEKAHSHQQRDYECMFETLCLTTD